MKKILLSIVLLFGLLSCEKENTNSDLQESSIPQKSVFEQFLIEYSAYGVVYREFDHGEATWDHLNFEALYILEQNLPSGIDEDSIPPVMAEIYVFEDEYHSDAIAFGVACDKKKQTGKANGQDYIHCPNSGNTCKNSMNKQNTPVLIFCDYIW